MNSEKNGFDSPSDCGRKEDLVTYLYDEANATERASFESHLDYCDACRSEMTTFGRVRRDLDAWQLGQLARPEIVLRRSRIDLLRELIGLFPAWVRGAALIGAAAAMLLVSLSMAGTRISLKDGDFSVNFGRTGNSTSPAPAVSSEEIGRIVQNAVAEEREKMEERYSARLASFKDQLDADHQAELRAARAEQRAQLRAAQAALQQEMRRFNRQNTSAGIRAFFAREDSGDPWGGAR
ncbi:MAG TPA: zf-HC2 domain-containing protein [Blastocatellia bacterium]|nr:zf-HC2 domain-containing protein [Blastocatellia bacterium]